MIYFTKQQNEILFKKCMNQEWFEMKYHPVKSIEFYEQVKKQKKELLEEFEKEFEKGIFDHVQFDEMIDGVPMNEEQVGTLFQIRTQDKVLFLRGISDQVKRNDIIKVIL